VDVTTFSDTNWKRNGAAKYKNGNLYINGEYDCSWWSPSCTALYGSAWYRDKIDVTNSFEASIRFKVEQHSSVSGNANGFTFTIQNSGLNAIGSSADPGWGALDISNSISVAVDVYMANEVKIFEDGDPDDDDWSLSSAGNFDDGNWHTMLVRYNHITFILSLYIDNMQDALTDLEINLENNLILGDDGKAWIGVTASGGSFVRSEFIIDEFTYSVTMTDITKTIFVGNGMLAATVGSNGIASGSFTIIARTTCSVEQRRGDDNWDIELLCTNNDNCPPSRVVVSNIVDNSDGTYAVSFSVTSAGTWQVYVSLPDEDPNAEHNIGYFLVN